MNKAGGIKLTTVAFAVLVMAVSAFINASVTDHHNLNQSMQQVDEQTGK